LTPFPDGGGAVLVEARGLGRSFGRRRVLSGIDLQVRPGESLAVAGPNGAGKTTLLRLLAGLMRPSTGEVRILGQALHPGAAEVRRSIGLLSHQSLLYDDLTLLENLTFAARLYGLHSAREIALAALDGVGLSARADERPPRLSRGLVQRAAIARALLHRPRVLLLDEPFTALDAAAGEQLRDLLRQRVAQGLGLILVTHHLAEAWELASRIAVLADGRWACQEARTGGVEDFLPRYRELIGA
jgi:heme ABC exporter ATP-binding subunit CcmA